MLKIGGIYREVESEDTDNHYFIIVDIFDSNYFVVDIKEDLPFANNQMIQEIVSKEVEYNLEDILPKYSKNAHDFNRGMNCHYFFYKKNKKHLTIVNSCDIIRL